MDWSTRMNRAIDYIEDNLAGDIDLARAARLALCSYNNLSGMFLAVTGVPLNEYIRRRRLTLAGMELQTGGDTILDIAMKYGYASPTAFTRAFQHQHKASPQYARSRRIPLVTYPRISLQIQVRGGTEMKVRTVEMPAFTIVGVKQTFRSDAAVNNIPAFWQELPRETYQTLYALANGAPKGLLGVCTDFMGDQQFDYYIAVATTVQPPEGFSAYEVPAATWAVLEKDGTLAELNARFWKEWLPSSGYRRADDSVPDFEVYPDDDMPKENYDYELWFPIVKD